MTDLTIIMPTYNKEKYIKKALDSIFEQETSYFFNILITDDCSTDKTLDIVQKYIDKKKIEIKILKSKKNGGLFNNIMKAYDKLDCKYFTVLDPDDYWCDKNKIQISLDYLEKHPDFTIYTSNIIVKEGKKTSKYITQENEQDFDFNDFINGTALLGQTSGTFFRNVIFNNGIPSYIKDFPESSKTRTFRGDTFRNVVHIQKGKAHYDPVCRSVYQITDEGIWTATDNLKREMLNINIYKDMFLLFKSKNIEILQKSYDKYKILIKQLPSTLMKNRKKEEEITKLYEELGQLQNIYLKFSDKLKISYENKNPIKNLIIRKIEKLYNRFIYFME